MRPRRLEIEGFASFRERTAIDFTDAELFVLVGPTGSGKSTVIDAITFALYGTVPRYDDRRLVAPVISQGLNEARVRLDFTAGGGDYSAVRIVARTKTGASTKEARLESADRGVLAGNADELSTEVEKLLGLSFEHFTRCVVLPQGEFAEFLHAKPAERQDLLVRLLGVDVYRRIAQAANQRAAEHRNRADLIAQRLDRELAGATAAALHEREERASALEALLVRIDAERPELEALSRAIEDARAAAMAAEERARLLESVRAPRDVTELTGRIGRAREALAAAEAAHAEALAARERAEKDREALPEKASLENVLRARTRHAELIVKLESMNTALTAAVAAAQAAAEVFTAAGSRWTEADDAYGRVQREHSAFALAEHLNAGEACPVCLRAMTELPAHEPPADLSDAKTARAEAETARDTARRAAASAERAVVAAQTDVNALTGQLGGIAGELDGQPTEKQARARLKKVDEADARLRAARSTESEARSAVVRAKDAVEAVEGESTKAVKAFHTMRDRIAGQGLAPPPLRHEGLGEDWSMLTAWAREQAPVIRQEIVSREREAGDAERTLAAKVEAQRAACADAGIAIAAARAPRDACADALAAARADADRMARDIETAAALASEQREHERAAATAKELGRQLDARRFEAWLMSRALRRLVIDATRVLRELSGGAYSLELDRSNNFLVTDHRNADERRMARTLSGGETFLASLSLALALADQVAELAAGGAVRLDALFLDEGFGTLDADTLDAVATAIEELGSRGRMVGLVTHVRDLAERIPIRFEVRKVGGASSVERV